MDKKVSSLGLQAMEVCAPVLPSFSTVAPSSPLLTPMLLNICVTKIYNQPMNCQDGPETNSFVTKHTCIRYLKGGHRCPTPFL